MAEGLFLLNDGLEHLVYRNNIPKPPQMYSIMFNLWNFNTHHDESQRDLALKQASDASMKGEPINIVKGTDNIFSIRDFFTTRDVDDNAPLSTIVQRLLCFIHNKGVVVFYDELLLTADFQIRQQRYPDIQELMRQGYKLAGYSTRPELTNAMLYMKSKGEEVAAAPTMLSRMMFAVYSR